MSVLEKRIEARVKLKAKLMGVNFIPLKLIPGHSTGIPDVLFLIPGGKPLFIEFKIPGKKRKTKQTYWRNLLLEAGYNAQTHDSADAALASIREAVDAAKVPEKSCKISVGARRGGAVS